MKRWEFKLGQDRQGKGMGKVEDLGIQANGPFSTREDVRNDTLWQMNAKEAKTDVHGRGLKKNVTEGSQEDDEFGLSLSLWQSSKPSLFLLAVSRREPRPKGVHSLTKVLNNARNYWHFIVGSGSRRAGGVRAKAAFGAPS